MQLRHLLTPSAAAATVRQARFEEEAMEVVGRCERGAAAAAAATAAVAADYYTLQCRQQHSGGNAPWIRKRGGQLHARRQRSAFGGGGRA